MRISGVRVDGEMRESVLDLYGLATRLVSSWKVIYVFSLIYGRRSGTSWSIELA